jgi:hypothetical protein
LNSAYLLYFFSLIFFVKNKKESRKKMLTSELQANFLQAILYYCGVTQSDDTRYFTENPGDLSAAVGTIDVDGNGDFFVNTWALGYAKPDNTTLAEPDLSDVTTFYNNAYARPTDIIQNQCFKAYSSSTIALIETEQLTDGMIIRNTTSHKLQRLASGVWTDMW